MKHIKRLASFCAALTLALSMSIGAFASGSPSTNSPVSNITGTDADGDSVTVTVSDPTNTLDDLKDVLGSDYNENLVVVDVKDVSVPEGTKFPVQLTFSVPGVTAGSNVIILQFDGTKWVKVPIDYIGNGTVTATFNYLSSIAIVVEKAAVSASGTTSPKTGTSPVVMMAMFGAVICMAGAVALTKKERA